MNTRRNRPHNAGTLEKKGNLWYVRYTDKTTGRRLRISTGESNRRNAESFMDKWVAERKLTEEMGNTVQQLHHVKAKLEARISTAKSTLMTLRAVPLDRMFDIVFDRAKASTVTPGTLLRYRHLMACFALWVQKNYGRMTADGVTSDIAHKFSESAEESHDKKRRTVILLRQAYRTLIAKGLCFENPFQGIFVKIDKRGQTKKRMLTEDEMKRLKETLKTKPLEIRLLFAFGIYTGQRFGDCRAMKWDYIKTDGKERFFEFFPAKTRKHGTKVTIPIAPELGRMLDEVKRGSTGGYIMPGLATRDRTSLVRFVCRIFTEAGIERKDENGKLVVGFHSLRHTFVSRLANSGKPLTVIRSMVGHTSDDMTEYYTHTTLEAQRNAISALSVNVVDTATITLPKQLVETLDRRRKEMPMEDFLKQLLWEHDNGDRDNIFV